MTTMMKRVAKAIDDVMFVWREQSGRWHENVDTSVLAHAAIIAIREPTPEMIEAGRNYWHSLGFRFFDAGECWQAMHAAMLDREAD